MTARKIPPQLQDEDWHLLGWPPGHPARDVTESLYALQASRGLKRRVFLHALETRNYDRLKRGAEAEELALIARLENLAGEAAVPSLEPERAAAEPVRGLMETPVPFRVWGASHIEASSLEQMRNVGRIPAAVRGALMPDAHHGYTMPIGGVLATRGVVIPSAVGVDIACRMCLTVLAVPASRLEGWRDRLRKTLQEETRFGLDARFEGNDRRQHAVLESARWADLPPTLKRLRDKAWPQLGTSGGGNHFVEWGEFSALPDARTLLPGLPEGEGPWLALLSHSGSRGMGAQIAAHYMEMAEERTRLPKPYTTIAWLNAASHEGCEYWNAMELAGEYASANHHLIHRHVLKSAGLDGAIAFSVENHHNFAWKETHHGEELIVHRKGATPAGLGVLGVIPGSMADPGFVVQGLGNPASLDSAAHGAGRRMSRTKARETLSRDGWRTYLKERGVELISGGIDEAPMAYKQIREVMAEQADLVRPLATFAPRLVLMAEDTPKFRGARFPAED